MKKLMEYKNEEAIELLADIMEPTAAIFVDEEVVQEYRGKNIMSAIQKALKKHAKEVIQIMATMNGEDVKTYTCNAITLPKTIFELLQDPELQDFFSSLAQTEDSSGSATEPTPGTENE